MGEAPKVAQIGSESPEMASGKLAMLEFEQVKSAWHLRKFLPESSHGYLAYMKYLYWGKYKGQGVSLSYPILAPESTP